MIPSREQEEGNKATGKITLEIHKQRSKRKRRKMKEGKHKEEKTKAQIEHKRERNAKRGGETLKKQKAMIVAEETMKPVMNWKAKDGMHSDMMRMQEKRTKAD